MFPSKKQWQGWSLPSKYGVIGVFLGFFGIVLTLCIFSYQEFGKSSSLNEIKELITQPNVHIVPGDLIFSLSEIKNNSYPDSYTVNLIVQARKTPVLLIRKAKVKSFTLDENYFVSENANFREFKITNIKSNKVSLEREADVAEIKLTIATMFVFVQPVDIVWNAKKLKDIEGGSIEVELFYQYQGREESKIVNVPIRFS